MWGNKIEIVFCSPAMVMKYLYCSMIAFFSSLKLCKCRDRLTLFCQSKYCHQNIPQIMFNITKTFRKNIVQGNIVFKIIVTFFCNIFGILTIISYKLLQLKAQWGNISSPSWTLPSEATGKILFYLYESLIRQM